MKIESLFKFKELFSSKLSQSFLITIAKLQKNHIDIIQKMKIMSLDIQLEDLKSVCELFSIRAPHKSEIEELINYQDKNNLSFVD